MPLAWMPYGWGADVTTVSAADHAPEEAWGPLVERIARGDREAERLFVQHFQRGIRTLVRRHSRPNDPAIDDLIQDVIVQVIERMRLGAIKEPAALPAYVRMMIVNATTAEYRRRKLRGEGASQDGMAELAAQLDDPGDRFDDEQIGLRIRALVDALPIRRDREVLVRFYLMEHDKSSICRDLGIEASHFHRVVHRARERLRELAVKNGLTRPG